jgi:Lon protease-like protein
VAEALPMFPLGTVLLPYAVLPLHVFEPRYRALVEACLSGTHELGVVLIERGSEVGGGDTRFSLGTVGRIVQVGRLDDGRYVLAVAGTDRLRVTRWLDDAPYPRAEVTRLPPPAGTPSADARAAVRPRLSRLLALRAELGEHAAPVGLELDDDPVRAAYEAAAAAGLGPLDAMGLLDVDDATELLHLLARLLDERLEVLEARLRS